MGYWNDYFSTIFKGRNIVTYKERRSIIHIVKDIKRADKIIFKEFPHLVEEKHEIIAALKNENKALTILAKLSSRIHYFLFNTLLQEFNLLKSINDLQKRLEKVGYKNLNQQEKKWVEILARQLHKLDDEDRIIYKDVMNIVAETEGEHRTLRDKVNLFMNNLKVQNIIEKPLARHEATVVKRSIRGIISETENIDKLIRGKKAAPEEFAQILYKIDEHFKRGIQESYMLKRRGTVWMIKVLFDFFELVDKADEYVKKHDIPEQEGLKQVQEKVRFVFTKEIIPNFREIAQGYRIIIQKVEAAEKKVRRGL